MVTNGGSAAEPEQPVAALLGRWRAGDAGALNALTPILYENLRQIARRYMVSEGSDHTLSATALVHEAYIRLLGAEVPWQDKAHFLAVASREMRRVLVDHARGSKRQKRGGDWRRVTLHDFEHASPDPATFDVVAIEDALERLGAFDHRKAQVVDLMIFGGLTAVEAAEVLEVSEITVRREWRMAKAWLSRDLMTSAGGAPGQDEA